MRKFICLLLPFYLFTFLPLKADEGMWTLYNLPNAVYEVMKQENYSSVLWRRCREELRRQLRRLLLWCRCIA